LGTVAGEGDEPPVPPDDEPPVPPDDEPPVPPDDEPPVPPDDEPPVPPDDEPPVPPDGEGRVKGAPDIEENVPGTGLGVPVGVIRVLGEELTEGVSEPAKYHNAIPKTIKQKHTPKTTATIITVLFIY
jgi:hypothetical protein